MIMNYVLSFCRITAASRIFSRNFYLPLLKPLTPKDALRTFKITGKWLLGTKIQHYIPVLFNHKKRRSRKAKNYGKIRHKYKHSYTYMAPVLDPENEGHKLLQSILDKKEMGDYYVYTVQDKMCNIVFPCKYELAIRDGDIIDILISQTNDKILIKLKNFKKVAVDLEYYDSDHILYQGEGATSIEEEKFHHHGKMTMSLAKIFEAKEIAEEWEMEMMKIVSKKKKQKGEGTKEWNEMMNESIKNLNWQQFEVDAKKVIDQIWEPAHEEHIGMQVKDLEKTNKVSQIILNQGKALLYQLPSMTEIPEVVKSMATATYHEFEEEDQDGNKNIIAGVKVTLSSGKECFITGQIVRSEEGEIFIPGQTIENEFGLTYSPGITINMDGTPTLIKGLIMGEEDSQAPMFLPTESSITADGELTFCRNPQEKSKAKPKKIFVKRTKGTKKMKKKLQNSDNNFSEHIVTTECSLPTNEGNEEEICNYSDSILDNSIVEEQVSIEAIVLVENTADADTTATATTDEEYSTDNEDENKMRDDIYKPFDDGMEKLINNLQDKKSDLEQKLENLRKLSVTLENAVTYINMQNAIEIASNITNDTDKMYKLADILLTLTRRASTFREKHDVNIKNINNPSMVYDTTFITDSDEKFRACNEKLKIALKSAVFAANEVFKTRPKDQLLALNTSSDIIKDALQDEKLLHELCLMMNTNIDRNEITTSIFKELTQVIAENKLEILKSAIKLFYRDVDQRCVLEKVVQILESDCDVLATAFKKVAKNNKTFTRKVIEHAKLKIDSVKTELGTRDALQRCIVDAAKEFADECLLELEYESDAFKVKEFISEAIGIANTLGLYEIEEILNGKLLENELSLFIGTKASIEFLKRFMIITKLCEKDYSMKTSLQRIRKHPECGRSDPRIRQLLKESASLISTTREIRTSLEIPLRLFQEQNFLAIEDCVYQKDRCLSPILISRKGIQAVVPKEEAKNVLVGRVPYMLIDESGVTNFKPMHMFSALKLGEARSKRLQNYASFTGRENEKPSENRRERIYPRNSPTKQSEVRRERKVSLNNSRMTA